MRPTRTALVAALATTATLALGASAGANVPGVSTTRLASRTPDGLFPNGPSADPAFSQDRAGASLLAYDSLASDIVPGDTNGHRDVFLVQRAPPFSSEARHGTPWLPGATQLISRGIGGAPANGDSFMPDVGGDRIHPPRCVAFLSAATNLVRGDTNGKVDAFVRDLRTGRTKRVSVSSTGGQSDGTTYDVDVSGACDRVAFTSDATNLALTHAPRTERFRPCRGRSRRCRARRIPSRRARAVTSAPPPGTRQVYVRVLNGSERDDAGLAGVTFLASASARGVAGNADSYEPSLGTLHGHGFRTGDTVAFTSRATNLAAGDANGLPDVYRRNFALGSVPRHSAAYMKRELRLVSATTGGGAGNGASDQPSSDDDGGRIAFRTAATNLFPNDSNGVADVVMADLRSRPPTIEVMSSNAHRTGLGNAASSSPANTVNGLDAYFLSDATNLSTFPGTDANCATDAMWWDEKTSQVWAESTDSDDRLSGNGSGGACPSTPTTPAENPAASNFGQFVGFEDANPLLDLAVADRAFPGLRDHPDQAARMAHDDPALHQVYVHFSDP